MAKAEQYQAGEFIAFYPAGARAKGRFRCADCGYGVTIHDELPTCPMCMGTSWEPVEWARVSAFKRGSLL